MFTTFGMEQCRRDDYDPDASLEYSEEETYQQFLDFYEDVLPEFRNVGKVIQFKVGMHSARGRAPLPFPPKSPVRRESLRGDVCHGAGPGLLSGTQALVTVTSFSW